MEHYYKLFIIGNSTVGKTALIQRYFNNKFSLANLGTDGIAIEKRTITIDDEDIHLEIRDTCGQERYRSICAQYYAHVDGIIIAFSIENRNSFEELDKWLEQIKENASSDICLILAGCKEDLKDERKVAYEEGLKYAEDNNMIYIETSAKTDYNIKELFEMISWAVKDKGIADKKPKNKSIKIYNQSELLKNSHQRSCPC